MAVTNFASQSALSVSSTELSLISGTSTLQSNTTAGVYQIMVDASNMAKGDEFILRVYEKTIAGGAKRLLFSCTLRNAQSELITLPGQMLLNGWDMTIQKTAGTDRAFDLSIRKAG